MVQHGINIKIALTSWFSRETEGGRCLFKSKTKGEARFFTFKRMKDPDMLGK